MTLKVELTFKKAEIIAPKLATGKFNVEVIHADSNTQIGHKPLVRNNAATFYDEKILLAIQPENLAAPITLKLSVVRSEAQYLGSFNLDLTQIGEDPFPVEKELTGQNLHILLKFSVRVCEMNIERLDQQQKMELLKFSTQLASTISQLTPRQQQSNRLAANLENQLAKYSVQLKNQKLSNALPISYRNKQKIQQSGLGYKTNNIQNLLQHIEESERNIQPSTKQAIDKTESQQITNQPDRPLQRSNLTQTIKGVQIKQAIKANTFNDYQYKKEAKLIEHQKVKKVREIKEVKEVVNQRQSVKYYQISAQRKNKIVENQASNEDEQAEQLHSQAIFVQQTKQEHLFSNQKESGEANNSLANKDQLHVNCEKPQNTAEQADQIFLPDQEQKTQQQRKSNQLKFKYQKQFSPIKSQQILEERVQSKKPQKSRKQTQQLMQKLIAQQKELRAGQSQLQISCGQWALILLSLLVSAFIKACIL